jgi:hypothetical protein
MYCIIPRTVRDPFFKGGLRNRPFFKGQFFSYFKEVRRYVPYVRLSRGPVPVDKLALTTTTIATTLEYVTVESFDSTLSREVLSFLAAVSLVQTNCSIRIESFYHWTFASNTCRD